MVKKNKRRVFITGNADGLGLAAAKTLLSQGHEVVVHVRSKERLGAVDDLVAGGAIARRWKHVFCNAVDPGWVPTKMGGSSASDDLRQGHLTQLWSERNN